MSQAYERFAKRRAEGTKKPAPKYNLHKISFDDSVDSSRSDIPNFFIGDKSEAEIPSIPMREKEKKREPPLVKQESLQELKIKPIPSPVAPPKKHQEVSSVNRSQEEEAEQEEQEDIPEPEAEIEPHTSLSLFQIVKLYLGEYLFRNHFPIKKAIYINNNNDQENEINKKEFEIKFKINEKEISHFDNSLTVSTSLFALAIILRNVFTYFYIYVWIAILVLQSIAENTTLNGPIQYGSQKKGLIVLVVVAVIIQLIADCLAVRKRRGWEENRMSYKVYHHNGKMAEWVNVKAHEIQPGHLYKVVPGECAPTDCVLIHSDHSLVHIKENHIISYLVESPSDVIIKETLLKGESVNLPFSGSLTYEISNPEYSDFQIIGKLNLEEPNEVSHPISMSQIILRGSINYSDTEILCLAMETGIDSLLMKNLQYPFQHRKVYEQSSHIKSKVISDEVSNDIKERQNTLLGASMEKRFESAVWAFIFIFLLLSGIGVVTNFLYHLTTPNEYYLTATTIPIINIVIYHLTNFIILVPVLLIPIFKLFVMLSGIVTESNISKRPIDIVPEHDKHYRTGSFSASRNEQLLDNKKIIFPVKIKDHNVLHQLSSVDTIITTIDSFRDESAFTLHSIKVKGITHNFATTSLDHEIYSTEAVEDIRTFMSSAILTTCKAQANTSFHYDDGIEFIAKKYLDLKKVKNAYGQVLINNNDQFKVKHLFSIRATSQYPYLVVFLEPIGGDMDENPEVLVLIRGDAKTILDKTYGKEIQLTVESRKLHEQKDYYVELLAKTAIKYSDALQIQRAYNSNSIEKVFFYRNLDKFISRVQPMGLLIFSNNFFQKKISQNIRNPILNKSIITQYKPQRTETYDADILASHHFPNLIILSPVSKSSQPEFQSIHTIKSLLTNSNLFNFSLSEVGDKILHEKPSSLEKMMDQLEAEKVMVWNGWDQKDIIYTIDILKKYGRNVLLYLEKDQYMYLMKECDCAVKGSKLGYDSSKYSDITLSSRSSISFFYLTQLIKYDAIVVKQGLLSLFLTQIAKFIFYLTIEFINLYYTRGSGLAVIRTPLYLVVEIVLFIDVFYYLNWRDSMRGETFNKRQHFSMELLVRIVHALLQAVFTTFVCLYSLESPPDSSGTSHSYHFPYFIIVFVFLHILVFEKLLNVLTYSFSIYKGLVILVQVLVLYVGFIIVSITDTYDYYGIIWSALIGKCFLTAVCCIWIGLTLPAIRLLLQLMSRGKKLKRGDQAKKTF